MQDRDPMEELYQQWNLLVRDMGIAFILVCSEGTFFMLMIYLLLEAIR